MTYIPDALRQLVVERAGSCCEYCLLHQDDAFQSHEIDHIYSEKHGGETIAENLCLSCMECNCHKGSDIASLDLETGEVAVLFNPRQDQWEDHFRLKNAVFEAFTPQGRITLRLLKLNNEQRVQRRNFLMKLGRYPCKKDLPK